MGNKSPLFPKASSEAHDLMIAHLSRNVHFMLALMRRVWPEALSGLGEPMAIEIEVEKPVTGPRGFLVGFLDVAVSVLAFHRGVGGMEQRNFYIECKSGNWSLGELLRQVAFYRRYIPPGLAGYWTVVSPVEQYVDVLEQQNIEFFRMEIPSPLLVSKRAPGRVIIGDASPMAILERLQHSQVEPA